MFPATNAGTMIGNEEKEQIRKSTHIALVLPKSPDEDSLASACAMALFFQKEGKRITVFSDSPIQPRIRSLDLGALRKSKAEGAGLVLTIKGNSHPIKEIRYEKNNETGDIDIIISSVSPLSRDSISVKEETVPIDLVITFGAPDIASIGSVWKKHPELFYGKTVLSIGEKLSGTHMVIGERVANLLCELSETPFTPAIATALLFSLFSKTDGLLKEKTSSAVYALASELIRSDARHENVAESFSKDGTFSMFQLWGRACVRSKIENEGSLFWSLLTADDFKKTGTTPEAISYVIRKMKDVFALPPLSVFLWQDPKTKNVRGTLIATGDMKAASIPEKEYSSFLSAEEDIAQLLRGFA